MGMRHGTQCVGLEVLMSYDMKRGEWSPYFDQGLEGRDSKYANANVGAMIMFVCKGERMSPYEKHVNHIFHHIVTRLILVFLLFQELISVFNVHLGAIGLN